MYNISSKNCFLIGVIVLFVIMSPYVFLGEDAFITIHDFLDSNPVHFNTILSLGLVGNPEGIIPVLDGVPVMTYMPLVPLDIKNLLYLLFPMYWAIVMNVLFVRIMAFVGMYLLCINYILRGNSLYSLFISLLFCLIPFYADYGLSSAGVPLFLYSAVNLENKRKLWSSYVLILFFALNSSLSLVGLFICFLWLLWIILKWNKDHSAPKIHILGLMLMSALYLAGNLSIIYNYFFPTDVVSHRVEFSNSGSPLLGILEIIMFYVISQYHAGSFFAGLVLFISLMVFLKKGKSDKTIRYYYLLFTIVACLMMLGRIVRMLPLQFFSSFQLDRFYFLYPTICFIILAKAFSLIPKQWKLVSLISVVVGLSVVGFDKEFRDNWGRATGLWDSGMPSYRQFFDTRLFNRIQEELNIEDNYKCKVVSVGMHPSIAEYNHFYTLDSYVYSYSLAYKHQFREVIAGELSKNEKLRMYFDNWGSRCYVFSAELREKRNQYLCGKNDSIEVDLDIDTEKLKEMGCDYILSSVDIINHEQLHLVQVGDFSESNSYWNIKVYRLD